MNFLPLATIDGILNHTPMKVPNINFWALALAGFMLTAGGCTTDSPNSEGAPQGAPDNIPAFQVVEMVIEGMTCEMSCAGRMYLKLDEMDGVGNIDIRFAKVEGNDNHDRALIEFDPSKLTQEDLVGAVNVVGGGVYFVKSTTLLNPHDTGTFDRNDKKRPADASETSYSTPGLRYELPNFLEVFTRLF